MNFVMGAEEFINGANFTRSGCTDINATAQFCQNYFAPYLQDIKLFGYLVLLAAIIFVLMNFRNRINKRVLAENAKIKADIITLGGKPREHSIGESMINGNFGPLMKEGIEDNELGKPNK